MANNNDVKYKLIDLSKWNGKVDFAKVKTSGIDGVIIRTGFGVKSPNQIDRRFEEYYAGAKSVGLYVGAYHYSYAQSVAEAKSEAEFCCEIIKGKKFEFPIYFDFEDKTQVHLSKQVCSEMVRAFCEVLEANGYWAGIYSYDSFFQTHLDSTIPKRYAAWVARVENVFPKYVDEPLIGVHQYSWKGKIDGISGDVDMDNAFKDYPSLIKSAKKNNLDDNISSYSVIAKQNNLSFEKANEVFTYLKKLGMEVEIKEG